MNRYNWKLLETHAMNYDGTCKYCGGKCKNKQAINDRQHIGLEIGFLQFTGENPNRLKYLQKRHENTKTYHFV